MKIRVEGTPQQCDAAISVLRTAFVVTNVSRQYSNRGNSDVRVYVDAEDVAPALPVNG